MRNNILILITLFLLIQCEKKKDSDANLLTQIAINCGTISCDNYKGYSVIAKLDRVDVSNFSGTCYDNFQMITAFQFFITNQNFLGGSLNNDLSKSGVGDSTTKTSSNPYGTSLGSNCYSLGFRDPGGILTSTENNIKYQTYRCGPGLPSLCTTDLAKKLGFSL
jgi:hypothetical protein